MTDPNPFEGFDMSALLQQAQAMQEQMVAASQELAEAEVVGTVADGLVTVTVNGTGDLMAVKIRAGSFDPDDTEDLEDMIVAAYRDAKSRADAEAASKLGPLAGGLGGWEGSVASTRVMTAVVSAADCRSVSKRGQCVRGNRPGPDRRAGPPAGRRAQIGPADRVLPTAGRAHRCAPTCPGVGRGQGEGQVLFGLRQRVRGGDLPDLSRPTT